LEQRNHKSSKTPVSQFDTFFMCPLGINSRVSTPKISLPASSSAFLFNPLLELFPDLREGFAWEGEKRHSTEKIIFQQSQPLEESFSSERIVQHQGGMNFA